MGLCPSGSAAIAAGSLDDLFFFSLPFLPDFLIAPSLDLLEEAACAVDVDVDASLFLADRALNAG